MYLFLSKRIRWQFRPFPDPIDCKGYNWIRLGCLQPLRDRILRPQVIQPRHLRDLVRISVVDGFLAIDGDLREQHCRSSPKCSG